MCGWGLPKKEIRGFLPSCVQVLTSDGGHDRGKLGDVACEFFKRKQAASGKNPEPVWTSNPSIAVAVESSHLC